MKSLAWLGKHPVGHWLRFGSMFAAGVSGAWAAAATPVPNWPQFRGVNGAGVAAEARPPVKIGPTESVRWSIEVPQSPSSPCVWGDRIFLTTFDDGHLKTRCYRRSDGRLRWTRRIKPEGIEEFHRQDGSPAASTPATDGRSVVSYFGTRILATPALVEDRIYVRTDTHLWALGSQ